MRLKNTNAPGSIKFKENCFLYLHIFPEFKDVKTKTKTVRLYSSY